MALPPASQIWWGVGLENLLDFDYPTVLDDVRHWRRPAPGSQRARNAAGVTDSAVYGYDYMLAGRARWFDNTRWSGGPGLQEFIDWAANNTFRFVPDKTVPDFYVDGCSLEAPFDESEPSLEQADGSQSIDLVLRNPTVDFGQALRGLMFEYAPGGSLTDPLTAAFTRATARSYHSSDLLVKSVAAGVLRDNHRHLGLRGTLIEPQRTNQYVRSEDFANASWIKNNCTLSSPNSPGPDGLATSSCGFTESTDGAPTTHNFTQTLPALVDNNNNAVSIYCRAGLRNWLLIQARNKAGGFSEASFNVATGTIGTVGSGSAYIEGPFHGAFGAFFYRCILTFNSSNGGTTPEVRFYSATGDGVAAATYTGSGLGALAFFGAQLEPQTNYPTGYIATVASTVTHNADTLNFPWTWPRQPMFVYVQWVEQSSDLSDSRLLTFGSSSFTAPYLAIQYLGGSMRAIHDTGTNFLASGNISTPNQNALMEALIYTTATGQVNFRLSTNGAADVVASASGNGPADPYYIPLSAQQLWFRSGNGAGTQRGFFRRIKVGPLVYAGITVDTLAKARVA